MPQAPTCCGRRTSSGEGARRTPVPSDVYMSSALPAFGKHSTRSLGQKSRRQALEGTHDQADPLHADKAWRGAVAGTQPGSRCHQMLRLWCSAKPPYLGLSQAVLLSARPGNHLRKVSASGGGKRAARSASVLPFSAPRPLTGGRSAPPLLKYARICSSLLSVQVAEASRVD